MARADTDTSPAVAGLVLAAGAGRRFGGPKGLALLDGERLVDRAVRTLRDGGCDPVYAVEGAAPLAPVPGATVVTATGWAEGMGASLRTGLAGVAGADPVPGACVVLLVDTPWLTPAAVHAVVAAWAGDRTAGAYAAAYDGERAHPVLLDARIWTEVSDLAREDEGARAWLRANPGRVREVDATGLADPRDVDVPADGVRPHGT